EDRILPVPQRQREAEVLPVVRDARQTVLAPAIRSRASLIVREVIPGVPRLAVVLAHRPPLALADIGTPLLPGNVSLARLRQSGFFCAVSLLHGSTVPLCAGQFACCACSPTGIAPLSGPPPPRACRCSRRRPRCRRGGRGPAPTPSGRCRS